MVQRKVIVRGATDQALDELDAADIPDLSVTYEAAGGIATHSADTTAVHGIVDTSALSLTDHDHDADYEAAGGIATHAGLADPHTGYRLESADHSHATTGLQAGQLAQANTHQSPDTDTGPTSLHHTLGAGANQAAAGDHVHGGASPWTAVIKPADTGRVNNTVSADPDLVATLLADTNYVLRFRVFMLTNATADSRYQLTFSGTTTRVRRQIMRTATGDVPALITIGTAFDAAPVVLSTTGLNPYVEERIILQVGASGGTFAFQWAQVTTNATPTSVLEGSFLEYAVT